MKFYKGKWKKYNVLMKDERLKAFIPETERLNEVMWLLRDSSIALVPNTLEDFNFMRGGDVFEHAKSYLSKQALKFWRLQKLLC
jgi:hypothetical protein